MRNLSQNAPCQGSWRERGREYIYIYIKREKGKREEQRGEGGAPITIYISFPLRTQAFKVEPLCRAVGGGESGWQGLRARDIRSWTGWGGRLECGCARM